MCVSEVVINGISRNVESRRGRLSSKVKNFFKAQPVSESMGLFLAVLFQDEQ